MTPKPAAGDDALVECFASLNVWRRGGERAPHKPLLLLWTLARVQRDEPRLAPFTAIEEHVGALHHKALDRGAIGLADDRRVLVSQHLRSDAGSVELLVRFNGRPLTGPQPGCPPPAVPNIAWHRREVFREPARAYD